MSGLCPARGYDNEDLAHLWWSSSAEQYAHIRDRAPQQTNLEEMHLPHRDVLLVQQDTQLLEWARNNRTEEVAAGMAAREMRSKVESSGSNDNDGDSKKTAGRIVEELGEYFRDGRHCRSGWVDLVSIRAGKRYRERVQESSSRKTAR